MDTLSAFALAQAHRNDPPKVFDWDRAATLIRAHQPNTAQAGLAADFENTGGDIYRDGKPVPREDTYVYLASVWATPTLILDGDEHDCWKLAADTPGWGSGTYWPDSALAILNT